MFQSVADFLALIFRKVV